MAAAVFPAYLLARRVLSVPWAYFAAVATIAAPALSYAPILVEEPWAYPAATVALWLTVRAIDGPGRASARARVRAPASLAVLDPLTARRAVRCPRRGAAGALVALGRMRRWRATWTTLGPRRRRRARRRRGDPARRLHGPPVERVGDRDEPLEGPHGRVRELGGRRVRDRRGRAPGRRAPRRPRRARRRSARGPGFAPSSSSPRGAVVGFGWYAAIKGAYLSTTFSSLIVERNLVYLTPLAFLATALPPRARSGAALGRRSPPAPRCSR